jgi:phenylacetic acid degradation protein PaaD
VSGTGSPAEVAARILAAHPAAGALGVELVGAGAGTAAVRLTVGDAMVNGLGVCHGGVVFALADLAATVAASGDDRAVAAVGSTVELLAPGQPGAGVTATAGVVHATGRAAVVDVTVTDDGGVVLALVRCRLRRGDGPAVPASAG